MVFGIQLLPQENKFFELLHESGEISYRVVHLLRDLLAEDNHERKLKLGQDIEIAKTRAKIITNDIAESLCKTFITPLDREDIHALAYGLYKIPKITEKVQERILTFGMPQLDEDFYQLASKMVEASEPLADLLRDLKSLKDLPLVQAKCALIHNVETQTDALLNGLLLKLYQGESDVKQIIFRRDIYALMEKVVDRHRDVAGVLLEIVLKNN